MKIQALTIAIVAFLAMSVAVFAAGSISISSVTIPSSVNQGDSFSITVSVSSSSASSASGTLSLPSGLSCTPSGSQSISLDSNGAGSATWSCTANVAGDYTSKITASVSATDSGTGSSLSATTQTGLRVLSPASLTVSSTLSASSISTVAGATLTIPINNAGDVSTTYSVSNPCPTHMTCTATTATSGTINGNSLVNVKYTVASADSVAGSYTLGGTVTGGNGQSVTAPSQTITVTAATATTTAASGGATTATTATTSATTATTAVTTTTTAPLPPPGVQPTVTSTVNTPAGGLALVIIPDVNSKVQEIDIKSKNAISGSVNVSQVLQPSSTLTNAYLYFQVTATNFTDSDVANATLKFKVEKSWLNQYNITADKISLYKFSVGWNSLPTTKLSDDATYVYYSASSSSLSLFAVAAQQPGLALPGNWWYYVIIVAIIVVAFFILRSRTGKNWKSLKEKWS